MHERIKVCSILALDDETYGIRCIEPSVDTKFVTVGTPRDVACNSLLFDGFERLQERLCSKAFKVRPAIQQGDPFVNLDLERGLG
jgi:hypothetical protein